MSPSPETRASLLVRLCDAQDGLAWEEFVEIYSPLVYRLARRRGLQDADARDLLQQVMLVVAQRVEKWDPDRAKGSFRGWLSRVARNLIVNLIINRRRHVRGTGDSEIQQLLDQQPVSDEASATFELEYRRRLFRWAAEQIRDEFHETTWLAFWQTSVEARDAKVVAADLEISVGAVYIARSRVLARLRQKVELRERSE